MEHWKRLGWPLILGALAAIVNWYNVTSRLQPRYYVAADNQIKAGELVQKDRLRRIGISGDYGLAQTAIPWEGRAILYDWRATRHLRPGDLILQRDMLPPPATANVSPDEFAFPICVRDLAVPKDLFVGDQVSFVLGTNSSHRAAAVDQFSESGLASYAEEIRQVGPFRVLAVDDRFLPADVESQVEGSDGNLKLSVPKYPDGAKKMTRLLNALQGRGEEVVLTILQHAEASESPAHNEEAERTAEPTGEDSIARN